MADLEVVERRSTNDPATRHPVSRSAWLLWNFRQSTLPYRIVILVLLGALWQAAALYKNNALMFPTLTATVAALWRGVTDEGLLMAALQSLAVLSKGYAVGMGLAIVLASLAALSRFMHELLSTLAAMFMPLPAIALLPLTMLWCGIGEKSLILVLVHSVVWPVATAVLTSFAGVPPTLRLVGRNYGFSGPRFVALILIPAALPGIITGLKIGWAFAWRTLIASELVFGISSSKGGLGWYIFMNRNELLTDNVFAGLAVVIIIGLLVEFGVFRLVEQHTIRRWGMQS
ncbi:MAG: ABC transporter permease [Hyphomicrobium sp.]|jgi:NitT/TauT family transport system permease protein